MATGDEADCRRCLGGPPEKKKKQSKKKEMAVVGFSITFTPSDRGGCSVRRHSKDSSFKLYRKRPAVVRAEVRFVNGDEAKKLVTDEGFKILDVRDRVQFERAHISSCSHVPLFIENKDNDLGTIIKRQVHNNFAGLFFGLAFTKLNPDFVRSVKQQFPEDSKLLVVCQEGLRSTAAANTLDEEGFENVACLTSGLQKLKPGTFDSVGSTELQNAGKAGLVTIQGKISAVLGAVLICAYLFITFFPDQAEKLLQMSSPSG